MLNKPWLKNYPAEVPESYNYPSHNLAYFLEQTAALYPNQTALEFLGRQITYQELLHQVYRFANALLQLGVRKGDRIAIMLPNCPQCVIAYYGTMLTGAVVVMTNPLYVPRELEHQLRDAGVRIVVTLDSFVERVKQGTQDFSLDYIIATSIKDYLPFLKNLLYPFVEKKEGTAVQVKYDKQLLAFKSLLKHASPEPCNVTIDADLDLALIQYTGGTTGYAKGVMLTHSNLIANTIQTKLWFYKGQVAKERYLAALPFFHVFGMTVLLNQAVLLAGTLLLVPRFKILDILQLIEKKETDCFSWCTYHVHRDHPLSRYSEV